MIIAAAYVAVLAALLVLIWTMQRRLMYFPTAGVPTPEEIGLADVEPVTFETTDGLTLSGWFVAPPGPSPRVTVLVFNGNAGNRAHRGPLAAALHRHGVQVLVVDYRGYGGNPGRPTEKGLAADSRAARAYLAGRPDVDASRIVYFGESLGTAVAVHLAVEHPPAALVLRSPFTSIINGPVPHRPSPTWLRTVAERDRVQRPETLPCATGDDIPWSGRLYSAIITGSTSGRPKMKFITVYSRLLLSWTRLILPDQQ